MTLERRCLLLAGALLAGQLGLVLAGSSVSPFAAVGAPAALGFGLVPLLPAELRARPLAVAALAVPIGALVLTLLVIACGAVGLTLSAGLVLACVALGPLAGVVADRVGVSAPVDRADVPRVGVAALVGALLVSVGLGLLANGATPFSGNDWAKYLLYADQVREQGSLLIDNPFWLLGQPFREDPGLPALYASLLLLSDGPAGPLVWGILLLMALSTAAVFGAVDVLFGTRAAGIAAVVFAIAPAAADMSAWHGAANTWGLVVLPVVLLVAGALVRGWTSWRWLVLGAAGLIALACAHRLTFTIGVAALGLLALGTLVRAPRATLVVGLRLLPLVVVIGALPAVDLLDRQGDSGGVLPYTAYLNTKLSWDFASRDLTYGLCALGLIALVANVDRARRLRDGAQWLPIALLAGVLLYTYGWVLHLPGFYARGVYFLPLVLALAVGVTFAGGSPWRRWLVPVAAACVLAAAVQAPQVADDAGEFYGFTDQAALRGYDVLAAELQPGEVVVADRCTSFLSTYLLQVPVLAALRDEEIGPKAELPRVKQAQDIIRGGARGADVARRVNARWLLLNANCPGRLLRPPSYARTRFVSNRLIVYRLEVDAAGGARAPRA